MSLCGMVVCELGMLSRIGLIALFVGFCCVPMRFGSFVVVLGGFVMVVFRHFGSSIGEHFTGPCPPDRVSAS